MQKARRHPKAPTACRRTVSGTISLCCSQYFSPFPYGTGSLSVTNEYLALPDGTGSFTQDFSGPALLRIPLVHTLVHLQGFHLMLLTIPGYSVSVYLLNVVLQPRNSTLSRFGLFPFRSPLLGESLLFSFPPGTQMFQFSGLAPLLVIHLQCTRLSHSEIYGYQLVCSSPQLIAAYHVLHRLLVPRHPPCALIRFKYCILQTNHTKILP